MTPPACDTALKEWATVLEAMARGEQLLLIRKGGLVEPGTGFELAATTFLFYPTFEHQAVSYLRPPFAGYFDQASARRAPAGQVRIELVGQAVASLRSTDVSLIERLAEFHVYNAAFATQRLKWQPETPLAFVAIRAYRLPEPRLVTIHPDYAGCTSWVALKQPEPLAGLVPVLEEAVFARRLDAVRRIAPPLT